MNISKNWTLFFIVALSLCAHAADRSIYNIEDYGAHGDGIASSTKQIQKTIDAAAAAGGGTVLVPPGKFVTGTIWLRSNINFCISPGATLLGSQDMEEFPLWQSHWEGPNVKPRRAPLIAGEDLENVSLTGRGTIDARGEMWWKLQRKAPKDTEVLRPLMFRLVNSRNVLVEGLTFRNSPMWTITPLACEDVTINNIIIQNPADSPNTDGINPDSCRNVHISGCHIDVGDDCVTIKSGKEDDGRKELRACENITITNCTMLHGHGGVVFGSEMSGSVRNVTISNCVFIGTDRGLRFKARRGRGGVIENISASNIIMDGVLCPIVVNLFYAPGAGESKKFAEATSQPVTEATPKFAHLRFSNIMARNVKLAAGYLVGLPEMPLEDVCCDNVSVFMDPKSKTAGRPDMSPGIASIARGGFIANRVDGLTIRNVQIHDQIGERFLIRDCKDIKQE